MESPEKTIESGSGTPFESGHLVEPRAGQRMETTLSDQTVAPSVPDPRHMARVARDAEAIIATHASLWRNLPRHIEPDPLARPHSGSRDPWPDDAQLEREARGRAERWRRTLDRLLGGEHASVREPAMIVDELTALASAHPERFGSLALLEPFPDGDLATYAVAAASAAIGTSLRLGWSVEHTRRAGLAALLADVGMALIPASTRTSSRSLTDLERSRVRRAPNFSVALLEQMVGVPEEVLLAIHQHHEREDGSGYPDGLRSDRLTDLGRVVAVAHVFAAACGRRRYRSTKRPFDVVREMIDLSLAGELSRHAIKALLELTGLFPVGSFVTLSNDQPAVVVAANSSMIDRPKVRVLGVRADGSQTAMTLDLATFDRQELRISRAIDRPARARL